MDFQVEDPHLTNNYNKLGGFSGGSDGEESACNVGDLGLISESGRSPGGENGLLTSVFLSGEFHGQRSLTGYSPWGRKRV